MRNTFCVLVLTLAFLSSLSTTAASQSGSPVAPPAKKVTIEDFGERVNAYVRLRNTTEDSFAALKSSKDSAEIAAHKIELAEMIVSARPDAHQGDIFTPKLAEKFLEIIRKTLRGPGTQDVRRTVEDKDPEKLITVRVNMVYPEDNPLQTTSPTLLGRLPDLPMDMGYRFIGRTFVLLDNKTRLIVDFIPNAIPRGF
jgi:hypothetical protein